VPKLAVGKVDPRSKTTWESDVGCQEEGSQEAERQEYEEKETQE